MSLFFLVRFFESDVQNPQRFLFAVFFYLDLLPLKTREFLQHFFILGCVEFRIGAIHENPKTPSLLFFVSPFLSVYLPFFCSLSFYLFFVVCALFECDLIIYLRFYKKDDEENGGVKEKKKNRSVDHRMKRKEQQGKNHNG